MKDISKELLFKVIENKSIEAHYQPIVSIIKKSIVGFEGLCRGIYNEDFIDPIPMFKRAYNEKLTTELDTICREKVIEDFIEIYSKYEDMLLFINIDGATLNNEIINSGFLIDIVNKYKLKPENIVFEIVESKVNNVQALIKFIYTYRQYGFLIAFDNVGSGSSNIDRITMAQPDIIKIDKELVKDIHTSVYGQEVFKSLVTLSKTIGAMVVAQGIETEEDAIKAIELGADMLQGYYFAHPHKLNMSMMKYFSQPVKRVAANYSSYLAEKISDEKAKYKEYGDIVKEVLNEISELNETEFDSKLVELINKYKIFECIYILNPAGIQVTDTVTRYSGLTRHKKLIYKPAKRGEDHSLKKYYYFLKNMKVSKYFTEPYISLATGKLCITMSCIFKNMENNKFIFCVDLNPINFRM